MFESKVTRTNESLTTFISFVYERRLVDMSTVIKSSIELFNYCPPAREAVLGFYSDLFEEYNIHHWNSKTVGGQIQDYVGEMTQRFYEMAKLKAADVREDSNLGVSTTRPSTSNRIRASSTRSASSLTGPASPTSSQVCPSPTNAPKIIPTGPKVIPLSPTAPSNGPLTEMDSTPRSPSIHENEELGVEESLTEEPGVKAVDIFPELENLFNLIRTNIEDILNKNPISSGDRRSLKLRTILSTWASNLLAKLSSNHTAMATQVATNISQRDNTSPLSCEIGLWLGNRANKILVDILVKSHPDIQALFIQMINSNQKCDWLLAHILLEMSQSASHDKEFDTTMNSIISCKKTMKSVAHILAYIFDTNPKAMAKFPKIIVPVHLLTLKTRKIKLNLDLLSQLLIDRLSSAMFDIVSVAQIIKLCCSSLEKIDRTKVAIGTRHRLCRSMTTCYFLLLEHDGENFPETLSYIRMSLTCMSLLKELSVGSHILCRELLNRSLVYGHLFNKDFDRDLIGEPDESYDWNCDNGIKLSIENLKIALGHRFRRLPNDIPDNNGGQRTKRRKQSSDTSDSDEQSNRRAINSYLLIEAFKSSINNMEDFSALFVEFLCPVMFDKNIWPNDDAMKVINERNLNILRKFEQVPPLWDLYKLIGEAGCLKSCLVLIKALMSAHLALWGSASTRSVIDRMKTTSRLIPPLARSSMIPPVFALSVEVFPHLQPNEVFAVLCDIWQYLRDTNGPYARNSETVDVAERKHLDRPYLNRLRLFMCERAPGPLYVKMFEKQSS